MSRVWKNHFHTVWQMAFPQSTVQTPQGCGNSISTPQPTVWKWHFHTLAYYVEMIFPHSWHLSFDFCKNTWKQFEQTFPLETWDRNDFKMMGRRAFFAQIVYYMRMAFPDSKLCRNEIIQLSWSFHTAREKSSRLGIIFSLVALPLV